jgi:acetyl esterase/lipase
MNLEKFPAVKVILTSIFFLSFLACEKNDLTSRNANNDDQVQVINDVQYGSNTDISGNVQNLKLDVYLPPKTTEVQKLPFVLFIHGGGFTAGDKSSGLNAMMSFAQAGFVSVSIDYRVAGSIDPTITDPCDIDTNITNKSIYMAVQDSRAAMRYMVANAEKYHIDTSRIFLVGSSAGAVTALNAYYLTQEDFNSYIPNVESELGGIDNADNNLTNTFRIVAMGANSGCLPSVNYINAQNAVPTIFFHGGADSVIPIDKGHSYYCPNTIYVYGSRSLYKRFEQLGKPAVLHVDPQGEHGPYTQDFLTQDEICFFNSVLGRKIETGSFSGDQSSCP